jgi:hypothetical protein
VRGAAAWLALVLACGCGPGRVVQRGVVNEDALAIVRRDLPPLRGLDFRASVPVAALGPAEIRDAMARELADTYGPEDFARLQAVLVRLGLLPAGTELQATLQRVYAEEGAGFYDPRQKRLVLATQALRAPGFWVGLVGALTRRDPVGEFLVAHELTHALQDQHYGLPTAPEPLVDGHGDRLLARRALLEGDATLTGFAYVLGEPPDEDMIAWIEHEIHRVPAHMAARYPDVPLLVRATLSFQYDAGTRFAGRALGAGGWGALDQAHADPPQSTEQILHPERYFERREPPVPVTVGGTEHLHATGWQRIVEDTLGEFHVRVLAEQSHPAETAARIADGWGGDRLRAFARGDEVLLVWMTAWDTPAEATEFAAALPAMTREAHVEQRGERVLVILGPSGQAAPPVATLAARVWSGTRVGATVSVSAADDRDSSRASCGQWAGVGSPP